jgi:hypothetical protein
MRPLDRDRVHFRATVFYAKQDASTLTVQRPRRTPGTFPPSSVRRPIACTSQRIPSPAQCRASLACITQRIHMSPIKTCKQCGQHKPHTDYYKNTVGIVFARCKACCIVNARTRYIANPNRFNDLARKAYVRDPRTRMAAQARKRDRRKGLESTVTAEMIVIPNVCPVLGVPLRVSQGLPADDSPSLDHIDPTRGAVWGNWCVISRRANSLKQQHTAESMAKFVSDVEEGAKSLKGAATLEEYRKVLGYLRDPFMRR